MSIQELLSELRARKASLSLAGDRLKCSAPKGSLTPELQREIAARKADIVAFLSQSSRAAAPRIAKADRDRPLPLSMSQERFWFLHRLQPENTAYNITAFQRSPEPVDAGILEDSVRELARRHECLRTSFEERDGAPVQVIHSAVPVQLKVVDFTAISGEERDRRARALFREYNRQPFDLSAAPLSRVALVRFKSEDLFLLTIHHSVADGTSLGIFFREIGEIYLALMRGLRPGLPDPPLQYADYAVWQRRELEGSTLEGELSYWRKKLEGRPGALELPADRRRPAMQAFEGSVYDFRVPAAVASALKSLAQEEGASVYMVLLAVFKVLLYRLTRQSDILVGSPVAGRDLPELENLIGCFINTLVMRTEISAEIGAREVVRRVRETVLEAHAHRTLPFERVLEALQPERDLSRPPLFQVAFILQNTAGSSTYGTFSANAMFDLTLYMWEAGDTFGGSFEYSTELFDQETVARMAGYFGALAEAMAARPGQSVGTLPVLPAAERDEVLVTWNRTACDYPRDSTVADLIAAQACRTPHSIAVTEPASEGREGRSITYAELDLRSNRLAHRLRALGIGPDVLAGICLDRTIDMVVALLGVLKAGGAYVPMDPHFPRERLAFMAEEAGLAVLITEDRHRSVVEAPEAASIVMDKDWPAIEQYSAEPPPRVASSDNLAYVIFTSGSTGKPKGVQVEHRSVVNFLHSMQLNPGLTSGDRLLSVTTLSFDIAGLEIYLPLITGAQVVLASRAAASDGQALAGLLADAQATAMQATPATWRLLLEAGWEGRKDLKILCGGEALPRDLAERLLATGAEVYNLYGPTETTIWSTVHHVTSAEDLVPIGKPIANTAIYILDENLQPVPRGVAGELYIGGDGLARGYLKRPELTAEKFVPDPFAPGKRMYRTGDLARWLPGGVVQYLGRQDHQVKLRGFRIELEEIENVLRRHPDVRDAAVALIDDGPGRQSLAGYVVLRSGYLDRTKSAAFARYLNAKLPDYMVPVTYTRLDALPLTANGKVDRKSLPPPVRSVEEAVAPRNYLELQLLSVWQQVLNLQGIGVRDNFFALGGHSLLAMKLFAQLEQLFGPLPVSLLFQAPTVEQMAAKMAADGRGSEWRSLVAIQPRGSRPPLFLVPGETGNVLTCTNLVMGLGSEQPVYGLQSIGLGGARKAPERIEEIAAHNISEMRSLQPEGPYHLAGHCIGGTIAYEMAQQLTAQGHEVGALVFIDTWPPATFARGIAGAIPMLDPALFFARRVWLSLRTLWQLEPAERMAQLRRKIGIVTRMTTRGETHDSLRSDLLAESVERANHRAIRAYRPKPYNGRITMIISDDGTPNTIDPGEWQALTGGNCQVHALSAPSHRSLMQQPWVRSVTDLLNAMLAGDKAATAGASR